MRKASTCLFLCLLAFIAHTAYSGENKILFREEFENLDDWRPLYFPKIQKHTTYTVEHKDGKSYLKAESNASASAIVYKKEFNVYEFPRIGWEWRAENIYRQGDAKTKAGDDYPMRIYIIFKYNPEAAGFLDKLKYNSLKLIYGEYPPHSSLNYIWSSREHPENILTSPYTDQSKVILLQKGDKNVGKWITEEVNIVKDYRQAFGSQPPPVASIAVMNDSDNTGEHSVSYVKYIQIYR